MAAPAPAAPTFSVPTGPRAFVLAVWAASSLALVWFVGTHQSDVPFGDEYDIVPVVTGRQPLTAGWLWSQHNEHRLPLSRLAQVVTLWATGENFYAGTWLIAALLCGLGLATAGVAERVRGRAAYTDAFFPLVTLHWGQVENLVWNWQIVFVLGILFSAGVLAVVVLGGNDLRLRPALAAGACLLSTPLCGGNGVLVAAPMGLWLGIQAVDGWGTPRLGGVRGSALVLVIAAAALGLCGVYFVGLKPGEPPPPGTTVRDEAEVALAFLSIGFGPGLGEYWWAGSAGMTALLAAAGWVAGRAALRPGGEWRRASGLVALLSTFPAFAALAGHARAGGGADAGLQSRYSTLWLPALWAVYLLFDLYLAPRPGRVARWGLFGVAVLMQGNAGFGLDYAGRFRDRRDAFGGDLDAGTPAFVLARRYYHHPFGLYPPGPERLDGWFLMLRDAGVGRFARMTPTPPHRDERLGPGNCAVGPEPGVIRPTRPRTVYAARLALRADGPGGQTVTLSWQGGPAGGSAALPGVGQFWNEYTVWVGGPVDQFRLASPPGRPPVTVGQIVLSVPPDEPR